MPQYMSQFSYTAEAFSALAKSGEDRRKAVGAVAEQVGGRLISYHFAFGKYDGVLVFEAPDDTSAAALLIASFSAGHLRALVTTKLLTYEEGLEAFGKVASLSLARPGQ